MVKIKFYAVREGRQVGIFNTWDEAKKLVQGYSGAIYKSFDNLADAEAFMEIESLSYEESSGRTFTNESISNIDVAKDLKNGKYHAFVDGSLISEKNKYKNLQPLYGVIVLLNNPLNDKSNELISIMMSGSVKKFGDVKDVTSGNQIAGEFMSALKAVNYAISIGAKEITLYYDYAGIEKTITNEWRAKTELAQEYKLQMDELMKQIKVNFVKTKGHNDVLFNEMVDMVAKFGKWLD